MPRRPRLVTVPYAAMIGRATPTPDEARDLAARIAGQQVRVGGSVMGYIANAYPSESGHGLVVELELAGAGADRDTVEAAIVGMYALDPSPGDGEPLPWNHPDADPLADMRAAVERDGRVGPEASDGR